MLVVILDFIDIARYISLRYSSNLSETFRIWHLNVLKSLGLFMTVRHLCSWQHQATSKGRWASKRLPSHFDKKFSCLDYLTGQAIPTERWLLNLPKGEIVLWGSWFMKDSARHSARHRRKWLNCLWNFLLHKTNSFRGNKILCFPGDCY